MCAHYNLISKNTGKLVKPEEMSADDFINDSYICNCCKSLYEFKDGKLIREVVIKSAGQTERSSS